MRGPCAAGNGGGRGLLALASGVLFYVLVPDRPARHCLSEGLGILWAAPGLTRRTVSSGKGGSNSHQSRSHWRSQSLAGYGFGLQVGEKPEAVRVKACGTVVVQVSFNADQADLGFAVAGEHDALDDVSLSFDWEGGEVFTRVIPAGGPVIVNANYFVGDVHCGKLAGTPCAFRRSRGSYSVVRRWRPLRDSVCGKELSGSVTWPASFEAPHTENWSFTNQVTSDNSHILGFRSRVIFWFFSSVYATARSGT